MIVEYLVQPAYQKLPSAVCDFYIFLVFYPRTTLCIIYTLQRLILIQQSLLPQQHNTIKNLIIKLTQ